jgi:hypothetical protein
MGAAATGAMNVVSGGMSLLSGMKGAKSASSGASKSDKAQAKLLELQADEAKKNIPLVDQMREGFGGLMGAGRRNAMNAFNEAEQYDPGAETEAMTRVYDQSWRQSRDNEMFAERDAQRQRGFGPGTSEEGGRLAALMARRSGDRAQFLTNLKLGERARKTEARGVSASMLGQIMGQTNPIAQGAANVGSMASAAGAYGDRAAAGYKRASSFNPAGSIETITSGFNTLKDAFKKKV